MKTRARSALDPIEAGVVRWLEDHGMRPDFLPAVLRVLSSRRREEREAVVISVEARRVAAAGRVSGAA